RRSYRARRLRRRHLLTFLQADSRRFALPATGRTPTGAHGTRRTRTVAPADSAPPGQAEAIFLSALSGPRAGPDRAECGTLALRPVRAYAARRAPSPGLSLARARRRAAA